MKISFNRRVQIAIRCSLVACIIHVLILLLNVLPFSSNWPQEISSLLIARGNELGITIAMIVFSTMFIERGGDDSDMQNIGYIPLIITVIFSLIGVMFSTAAGVIVVVFFLIACILESDEIWIFFLCSLMGIFFGSQYTHPNLLWICWLYIGLMVIIAIFHPSSSAKITKFLIAAD